MEVTAIRLEKNNSPSIIELHSNAMAFQEYTLSAEVSGNIIKITKLEGEGVDANEIFAKIDSAKHEIALKNSEQQLFAIEAELKKSSLKLERYHELLLKEIISQQEFEEVLYKEKNLLSKFNSQFEDVRQAKLDLDKCHIRPNFNGIISRKYVNEGDFVNVGDRLFKITNGEILEISIYIPDFYINKINKGSSALIKTKNLGNIETKIDRIISRVENTTGTFMAKVYLDNFLGIVPGEEIVVEVGLHSDPNTLRINKDSVNNTEKGKFVYKIIKNKVYPVEINIVENQDGYFLAKGDLKEGDIVVLEGNETLIPGQKVKVVSIKE
jgi:membrane fusion protein (multidrug efflux system)